MKKGTDGYYRHTWTYEGKRYCVRATTERDLWKKVSEKERALETGQIVTNANTRAEQWMYDYIDTYKRPSITGDTYKQLLAYVRNYIAPTIGMLRLKDVRPINLQRIINGCAGQSLSQATKLRNLIQGAFRRARINKLILDDPAEDLTLPDTEDGTHRPITDLEREHILKLCETHRAGLWVLLMLYCGARPVETRGLTWDDIDWKNHLLRIQSAKTDYGARFVPIPVPLLTRLEDARKAARMPYIVFQPSTGKQHTKTSMRQMWLNFKRALDIQMGAQTFRGSIIPETSVVAADLTPYCLRHTYGTDLQTAGVPINVAKDLMGHKDLKMTAKIYTRLSSESLAEAGARIEELAAARERKKVVSLSG